MPDRAIQANKYKLFTVGAIGTFMSTLDGSILNVALPTISESLHASVGLVAWVVLSYSLTLIALMLVFDAWTEARGYAFAYKFGYYFFLLGSLMCALSGSVYMLIASRVIQAVGTSMFAAIGPGMVSRVFPDNERGKGIGMMVMMVAGGFMVGPPLGGLILAVFPWQAIFLINLPIGLFGLVFVYKFFRVLPPHVADRRVRFGGAVSISVGLTSGVFLVKQLNDHTVPNVILWALLATTIIGIAAFFRFESRPATALIGLGTFRNRLFTMSILTQLAHFVSTSGVFILIPFYLERVKGYEPKTVGLFLIILPILMFVVSPLAGRLSDRIGFRALTTAGMAISAAGLLLLSGLQVDTSSAYIIMALVVCGLGIGTFSTPNSSAMMGSVSPEQRAVTSGILATNRNMGMSLGIALATALYTHFESANAAIMDDKVRFVTSYHPVIHVAVLIAAIGMLFCLVRGERSSNKPVDRRAGGC